MDIHVYDKARWHQDSIIEAGLSEGQEFVHTGLYVGWLIEKGLLSEEMLEDCADEIAAFNQRKKTGPQIFGNDWDGVLSDEMLSEEGNAFSLKYFDFGKKGLFTQDYKKIFGVSDDNDFFSVEDSWENYDKIRACFERAFEQCNNPPSKAWWKFWE